MGFIEEFCEKHKEGILYVLFGGFTVLVSWGTYSLFVLAGIDLNFSNWLSIACSLVFAFVVNKWMVFKSHSLERSVLAKEIVSFFSLRAVTLIFRVVGFDLLIRFGMVQSILGIDGAVALFIVTIIEIVLNYLISKFIVFRKKKGNA